MENDFEIKKIIRVEAKGVNTYLFYAGGDREMVGNSIDELEEEFSEWNFVRIHPRHLINRDYYKRMSAFSSPAVELSDGTLLPADRELISGMIPDKQKNWKQRLLQIIHLKF